MLTAFAVASCNDDCDHGFKTDEKISEILVGSWYEETQNEEDVYSPSGTFYGKFCNTVVQGEGNGRYIIDSERNRLKWSYIVNGSSQTIDWKLTNVSDLGFTMSSDIAILTYGKIVESFMMKGGDTNQISFNKETILGYESNNNNIATVSSDGLISASGEKGTAYIKIKLNDKNVWAKVVVGDETPDLWIDYSFLLGKDFYTVKDTLGKQTQSKDNGEYTIFTYVTNAHNILDGLFVIIDNKSHFVNQIDMYIREGVTHEEIFAYMNSHYYKIEGDFGNQYHYSTSSTLDESRAVYAYNAEKKIVSILSKDDYVEIMNPAPYPNLEVVFGHNKEQVKSEMNKRGYTFYKSLDNYSYNGSDAYLISDSRYDYYKAVEFVFNPDNVVSEYWLYLKTEDQDVYERMAEVMAYLAENYTEAKDEYVEGRGSVYYNKDKTLKIRINMSPFAVVFTDLTKKAIARVILGTYWKGLGMNHDELLSTYGPPYLERLNKQGDLQCHYEIDDDYITSYTFNFNNNNVVNLVNIFLRDEVNSGVIKNYLNNLYTFKEEEASENGPRLIWLDAPKEEDAKMRISFYPNYNVVAYASLNNEEANVAEFSLPNYTVMYGKTKTQVQEMIQSKGGSFGLFGTQVWYLDPKEENINQIWFDFNTSGDWKCNQIIFWIEMGNLTEEDVVNCLKSKYNIKSESKGIKYVFEDVANSLSIIYEPSQNKITQIKL